MRCRQCLFVSRRSALPVSGVAGGDPPALPCDDSAVPHAATHTLLPPLRCAPLSSLCFPFSLLYLHPPAQVKSRNVALRWEALEAVFRAAVDTGGSMTAYRQAWDTGALLREWECNPMKAQCKVQGWAAMHEMLQDQHTDSLRSRKVLQRRLPSPACWPVWGGRHLPTPAPHIGSLKLRYALPLQGAGGSTCCRRSGRGRVATAAATAGG